MDEFPQEPTDEPLGKELGSYLIRVTLRGDEDANLVAPEISFIETVVENAMTERTPGMKARARAERIDK